MQNLKHDGSAAAFQKKTTNSHFIGMLNDDSEKQITETFSTSNSSDKDHQNSKKPVTNNDENEEQHFGQNMEQNIEANEQNTTFTASLIRKESENNLNF